MASPPPTPRASSSPVPTSAAAPPVSTPPSNLHHPLPSQLKNIDSRQVMIVIRQERFGIRFAWIDFLMLWLEQGKRQNKLLYQRMLLIIKATDQEE
ncbi:hypothetical protein AAZX31_11G136700 [Glycine max]